MGRGLRILPNPFGHLGHGGMQVVSGVLPYRTRVKALLPVIYWPLDEAVGTTGAGSVLDASGNGHTGTPSGDVVFGSAGVVAGQTSCTFSGAAGRIQSANSEIITCPGSWSFWAKCDWDIADNYDFFSVTQGSNYIGTIKDGAGQVNTIYNGGTLVQCRTSGVTGAGWRSIIVTWTYPGDLITYVDGAAATPTATTGAYSGGATVLYFNNVGYGNFVGSVCQFSAYDRVLSAVEIATLSNP
jgi:hypothetical protein